MNKKDYVDAINEIKGSDNLKNKTLNNIKEKKNNWKLYTALGTVAVCIVAMVIAIPLSLNEEPQPIVKIADNGESKELPTIGTFENFCEIMSKKASGYGGGGMLFEASTDSVMESTTSSMNDTSTKQDSDYSSTNVQVEGVDEADIVKTDGNYIYYISDSKVVIIKADTLEIVSEIKYKSDVNSKEYFTPSELFIDNNKLIVIGNKYVYDDATKETPYYYYYYNSDQYTAAKIYNMQNASQPNLEREIETEGSYVSSRMIDGNIYMVSTKYLYSYIFTDYVLDELDEDEYKPKYKDTVVSEELQCLAYSDIAYIPDSEDSNYLSIAGFNVNNSEPSKIETYLGAGAEIYSSEDNLYITQTHYEYEEEGKYWYGNYEVSTNIYKFNLDNANFTFAAKGSVPGYAINQFAMDESDGYFRIATTISDNWWDETDASKNNMYVLNENLETVGKIEGLAKGERIYSVRFMGNRAYMVTFVQTDPLFVIDLSDPTNPTVLGELKIPGYSTYLHPYDETHIIGFGEDTKTVNYGYGDVVTTNGMKMALFDVSDPSNPIEMYSEKIGDKYTWSELLYNHKALLFSKEKNIIAFPVSICSNENSRYSDLVFQGAIVYGLDLETGFSLKGKIAHMNVGNSYYDYDYDKAIDRIIYIKDNLYTLSSALVKATNMNTMEEVNSADIEVEHDYGYVGPIDYLID